MPAPRSPGGSPADAALAELALCVLLQQTPPARGRAVALIPGALETVLARLACQAGPGLPPADETSDACWSGGCEAASGLRH